MQHYLPRLACIAVLVLGGVNLAAGAETRGAASSEPLTVVLLPARAHVVKIGMKLQPSDEWTAAAGAAVDAALKQVAGQSPLLSVRELPSLTREESAAIDEFLAVATRIQMQGYGAGAKATTRSLRAFIDRSFGPSIKYLRDRAGADYALVALGFQAEQSDGTVALSAAGVLASVLLPPLLVLPASTLSYAALFLVELRTGEVRWFNGRAGHEVGGYNFTDLREPESTTKLITALLRPYPKIPEGLEGPIAPAVAPRGLAMETVSPPIGEFALRTPVDWRVETDPRKRFVIATRDGRLLNELKVESRRHGHAFPESGKKSARDTTPDQLARWYAAELQAEKLEDLQIGEISLDGKLAGRAAFRMHFSYRAPVEWGGARMERITVGAATPRGLLLSELSAPQLFYFPQSLPEFEQATATITLEPRKSAR